MRKDKAEKIIGVKKGQLTILSIAPSICKDRRTCVKVKCDCGTEKIIPLSRFNAGTKSCGCLHTKMIVERNTSHGKSSHPLYNIWSLLKSRCYSPQNKSFHNYGGRGVVVCDEWVNDFNSFYNWAIANGWERGLEIDKDIRAKELGIDSLIYSPEMCCFVTGKVNCNSKRNNHLVEYEGRKYTITELAEFHGLTYNKIRSRLKAGWDIKRTLFTPIGPTGKKYNRQPEIKYAFGFIG